MAVFQTRNTTGTGVLYINKIKEITVRADTLSGGAVEVKFQADKPDFWSYVILSAQDRDELIRLLTLSRDGGIV